MKEPKTGVISYLDPDDSDAISTPIGEISFNGRVDAYIFLADFQKFPNIKEGDKVKFSVNIATGMANILEVNPR